MNCLEINEAIRSNLGARVDYLGCFLADDVRKILTKIHKKRPVVFIMNTLESGSRNKMGHWITFYVNKDEGRSEIVILDSYANPAIGSYSRYFEEFMSYFQDYTLYIMKKRIQSLNSYFCGNYAVYFAYHFCRLGLEAALLHFDEAFKYGHFRKNDEKVLKFNYAQMKMPVCKQTFCLNGSDAECETLCDEVG